MFCYYQIRAPTSCCEQHSVCGKNATCLVKTHLFMSCCRQSSFSGFFLSCTECMVHDFLVCWDEMIWKQLHLPWNTVTNSAQLGESADIWMTYDSVIIWKHVVNMLNQKLQLITLQGLDGIKITDHGHKSSLNGAFDILSISDVAGQGWGWACCFANCEKCRALCHVSLTLFRIEEKC